MKKIWDCGPEPLTKIVEFFLKSRPEPPTLLFLGLIEFSKFKFYKTWLVCLCFEIQIVLEMATCSFEYLEFEFNKTWLLKTVLFEILTPEFIISSNV